MANKKIWIVLAVIFVVIMMTIKEEKKEYWDRRSECEDAADDDRREGDVCVTECYSITSSLHNCLVGYGYTRYDDNIGEYNFMDSSDMTCTDYLQDRIAAGKVKYIGLANCEPIIGQYYTPCTVTSWSPSTSTICSGQSFTQTSNCGNTRGATGTKVCLDCSSLESTAISSIINWVSNPTSSKRITAIGAIVNWASQC